jgi:diguanylate cyclase (GGDEF)-like protein
MLMRARLAAADRMLARLSRTQIIIAASSVVICIGFLDYLTGYEVSISEFYLAPVAIAAWYAGRRASVGVAVLSCITWFIADTSAGLQYEHFATLLWNTFIRLGFFIVNGLLVGALQESRSHHRQLARTDHLTGAFGRRAFEERLEHDLDLARRKGGPLTLAFVDLDNFKALNDMLGHSVGDQALCATAMALQGATRRSDTVARLGGDEFAFVLPDTDRCEAKEMVARLGRDLRQALHSVAPELTCSMGVITFEDGPPDAKEALRVADALMYDAKRQGKDAVAFGVVVNGTREAAQPGAAADAPQAARR